MVMIGGVVGAFMGAVSAKYVETLLYGVKAHDAEMMVIPMVTVVCVAAMATAPAVMYALNVEPAEILRAE